MSAEWDGVIFGAVIGLIFVAPILGVVWFMNRHPRHPRSLKLQDPETHGDQGGAPIIEHAAIRPMAPDIGSGLLAGAEPHDHADPYLSNVTKFSVGDICHVQGEDLPRVFTKIVKR